MRASVSVLIPALSTGSFLTEAVESALRDAECDVQVVVVFDGPKPSLASEVWSSDRRVIVGATGTRSGAAVALNFAAKLASGEFLARLDADDLTYGGRFSAQVAYLRDNPDVVLVGSEGFVIDENGHLLGTYPTRASADVRALLLKRNPLIHSSFMFRRRDFERLGGYDSTCIRMQDYELLLRYALSGRIAILGSPMVGYRHHSSQSSRKLSGFVGLMRLISRRRQDLAVELGSRSLLQGATNLAFAAGQLLRYANLRAPRYITRMSVTDQQR
jgi:glycosyltransferase involved in cell wall biosynthesis